MNSSVPGSTFRRRKRACRSIAPATPCAACIIASSRRQNSCAARRWFGVALEPTHARGLYIPPGVAHGFLTLDPDSDVLYQIDRAYRPGFDAGVRWNDPQFAIEWPAVPAVIDPRDRDFPDLV